MQKTKLGGRFWLALTVFSLVGQVAWVVENMYFNVFIYKMFHATAAQISPVSYTHLEEDDVILIADDGIIIRIPCEQIAVQSRYGGGVHAMRLEEGSRVVALARAPREEDDENLDEGEDAENTAEPVTDEPETAEE